MDCTPAIDQKAAIRYLLGQRVLERILRLRKEARLVEKFRGLQMRELLAQLLLGVVDDGVEQVERDVPSNDGGRLQ
jgi:hypothetical protein